MPVPANTPFDLGPGAGLDPAVRAFRTLLYLAQRLRYLMDERLRPDGLTTQQAALLTAVRALDGPSLARAAAALGTTHQNAAQLVSALERKGLLRTESDPADRRRRRLRTTQEHERYWRDRDPADHAAVRAWFAPLSAAELDTLCELADRVVAGLAPGYATPGDATDGG